jgi:ubiquinone biosynthesis protein COQ9
MLPRAHLARLPQKAFLRPILTPIRSNPFQRRTFAQQASKPLTEQILDRALTHVPDLGFSEAALAQGARDVGCLDATSNLFPSGPFHIVNHHLTSARSQLKKVELVGEVTHGEVRPKLGTGQAVRKLCLARLKENQPLIHRWSEVGHTKSSHSS